MRLLLFQPGIHQRDVGDGMPAVRQRRAAGIDPPVAEIARLPVADPQQSFRRFAAARRPIAVDVDGSGAGGAAELGDGIAAEEAGQMQPEAHLQAIGVSQPPGLRRVLKADTVNGDETGDARHSDEIRRRRVPSGGIAR
ncbi:MAG TPA: hypothetical protein VFB58_01230 [Chloroflexota bacterium]|nr:hypothetical protein [Chloroflexota bacterium]